MLRRPPARRLAALALCLAALAGCAVPSNTPESYEGSVEEFFMDGCQGGGTTDDTTTIEVDGTTTTLAGRDECKCAFDVLRERVPYNDKAKDEDERFADYDGPTFVEIDDKAGGDPAGALEKLPPAIREEIQACGTAG